MRFFLHDPPHFYRGPEGECGKIRADRLRERKIDECALHKSTIDGKLKDQELEYATSFFDRFLMPFFPRLLYI